MEYSNRLERTAPEQVGLDSRGVLAYLDYLERSGTEMHGLMILRRGKVAAEGWWAPYSPALRHNSWSLSKSYVATAVGAACSRGLLRLDDPILRYFAAEAPAQPSPELQRLQIRHLLSMSCGMEPERLDWSEDWIRRFFATPILHEPGSTFFYNNEASTILAVLVERVTGRPLIDFLMEAVLEKIGVRREEISCIRLRDGSSFGAAGIFSTTEANARLGQLYLQKGCWNGEQVLPAQWVREASSKHVEVSFPKMAEMKGPMRKMRFEHAQAGYGYQMWMCAYPEAFRFDGAMGQYVAVLPTQDLVVAISESSTASPDGPMCALNALFDYLVPALDNGAEPDPEAQQLLQKRLAGLSLPRLTEGTAGTHAAAPEAFALEGPAPISLVPDIFAHLVGRPAPMQTLSLTFDQEQCRLRWTDAAGEHRLNAGMDGLPRLNMLSLGLPIAGYASAQAAWTGASQLSVQIRYPETCFSMLLQLELGETPSLTRCENLTFDGSPVKPVTAALRRIPQR